MKLRLRSAVSGGVVPPRPAAALVDAVTSWRLSALWSLSAVLLAVPVQATPPAPTVHPPKKHATPAVSRPAAAKRRKHDLASTDDEYAHVYYEFSPSRGFHVYVRAAGGSVREITDEPGWEARHRKALEAHHRERRERYIRLHRELDPTLRNAIEAGRLVQGMTTEQARACAGRPVEEKRTLTRDALVEDWRYGVELLDGTGELPHFDIAESCGPGVRGNASSCVLHFVDGVLVGWESPAIGTARRGAPR